MSFPPIAELLPHKPPMLLLDAVTGFEEDAAECSVTIRDSSTFFERGGVPAWVAMEYCAQCIAAFAGLRARQNGGEPRMGLLVAARDLTLHTDVFHAGETLVIRVRREFGEERVGRFECTVTREGVVVATASLSVYLPAGGTSDELAQPL